MRTEFDVVIAGGGYVGLSLGCALAGANAGLRIAVAEPRPLGGSPDGRASAIAAAGRRLFERLDVWADIVADAQPINEMIVTDSRLEDSTRPVFLTFAGAPEAGRPFAYMVPNATMVTALARRAAALGVTLLPPTRIDGFDVGPARVTLRTVPDQGALSTRLLVAADGAKSRLRDLAAIRTVTWDYGQSGIVATVTHERPHGGRAEEHFLPAGPFAILPLTDDAQGRHRSSLVWTERSRQADRIVALDDFTFRLELERRFGRHLGDLGLAGPRRAFPLGLQLTRDWVKPRLALVGDAAHAIHPIAGQGLNLGLRDVAALAEVVVDAGRLGLDIGALDVIERYQAWRRFDTFEMGVVTDVLNRLFANDFSPLRLARDVGLGLVDRLPALKERFVDEAAGSGAGVPRLLLGEAL
ncbi:MAG: ubiquinone biosynthesis hydroxylase [Ancalomicrobiaceae bacterium]|nr:ubiquinone biosynthesis hydroxylase [Ancalomicrobiaceae bacterium]